MAKKKNRSRDGIDAGGERRDAELFEEEDLADGVWIPHGFVWNSPGRMKDRAREMEEFAADELNPETGDRERR